MDLLALDYFVKVVEVGSVARAARIHKHPKSTMSAKILKLEESLGVQLFDRVGHKFVPTDAGRELLGRARRLMRECNSTYDAMAKFNNVVAGTLRVASTGEFGSSFMGKLIFAFRQRYPNVNIDLTFHFPGMMNLLSPHDGFDAILTWGVPREDSPFQKMIGSAAFGLFASPSYLEKFGCPQKPEDLHTHRGLIYREAFGDQYWSLRSNKKLIEVHPKTEIIANDYWILKYIAVCGEGISYLPKFFTEIECECGNLVPVLPLWESDKQGIFLQYSDNKSGATRLFVDFCEEYFTNTYKFPGPDYYVEAIR